MRIIHLLVAACATGLGGDAVGVWKLSLGRSTFATDRHPRSLTLRIERHASGEVFTVDRTEQDGRSTTDSTVLFLDGKPRKYQDLDCTGTQSSQRVDHRTVEILRTCATGDRTRIVRRLSSAGDMILEITTRQADGREVERRLVLEKK